MLDAHAVQADVDALDDAAGGEVEVGRVVAAELGAEQVAVARHAAQGRRRAALATCPGRRRATCR